MIEFEWWKVTKVASSECRCVIWKGWISSFWRSLECSTKPIAMAQGVWRIFLHLASCNFVESFSFMLFSSKFIEYMAPILHHQSTSPGCKTKKNMNNAFHPPPTPWVFFSIGFPHWLVGVLRENPTLVTPVFPAFWVGHRAYAPSKAVTGGFGASSFPTAMEEGATLLASTEASATSSQRRSITDFTEDLVVLYVFCSPLKMIDL